MAFNSTIALAGGASIDIPIEIGRPVFIVGANGTGKSSLMQRLYSQNISNSKRLSAHRQTWLTANTIEFSSSQKKQNETSLLNFDRQDTARWKDDMAGFRAGLALFELIRAQNSWARSIAELVSGVNLDAAARAAQIAAPLGKVNQLFSLSGMPIDLLLDREETLFARRQKGQYYSIAELSDGERNALLLSSSILTCKTGTLILLDEPERHLHRSIISPLLLQIFAMRSDCAFVISTHDLSLPSDNPEFSTVLVRSCTYEGPKVHHWDLDILSADGDINDSSRAAILGGRRKILFIEGEDHSLDKLLYSAIFPDVSIAPRSTCKDVRDHVNAIRASANLHWIEAFGVVDRDQMLQAEIETLEEENIFALSTYSVESIFYHPEIQKSVCMRYAQIIGADPLALIEKAKSGALATVPPHTERLSARMVERAVRGKLSEAAPKWKDLGAISDLNITIDVAELLKRENDRISFMLENRALSEIIERYPVRETPMLSIIAETLGFKDRTQYESAVRQAVLDEKPVRELVLSFFGSLPSAMSGSECGDRSTIPQARA